MLYEHLQLDRTIDCFSLLATGITPDTMKANPQGRGFQVKSRSIPASSIRSKVCGVFNNRDLSSASGKQPKAAAIAFYYFGVSWSPLTNNSIEDFLCLAMGFCQIVYSLGHEPQVV